MRNLNFSLLAGVLLTAAAAGPAAAATHTWTGSGDGVHWSDGANWTGGAPTSLESGGTFVVFGSSTTSTQDIVGLVIDKLTLGGANTINGTTALGFTPQGFIEAVGINTLTASLPIVIGGNSLAVTLTSLISTLTIDGVISGSGTLSMNSPGATLILNGANTFVGTLLVADGTIRLGAAGVSAPHNVSVGDCSGMPDSAVLDIKAANQLPASAFLSVCADGMVQTNAFPTTVGSVSMESGLITTNGGIFTLLGDLSATSGVNGAANILGFVDLGTAVRTFAIGPGIGAPSLQVAGGITGTGSAGITKTGTGVLLFSGSQPNTYPGKTTVQQGGLELSKSAGVDAIEGPLVIAGTVTITANEQVNNGVGMEVLAGGRFNFTSGTETIGSLIMHTGGPSNSLVEGCCSGKFMVQTTMSIVSDGPGTSLAILSNLYLVNSPQLISVADAPNRTPDVVLERVAGPGGLSKSGAGSMRLDGANTYTGTTFVPAGDFSVDGFGSSTTPVMLTGGSISGNSRIAGLGGTFGKITPGMSPGFILVDGPMSLTSSMSYDVEIQGTSLSSYDHINAVGPVSLGNAKLNLILLNGFIPPSNSQYTIITSGNGQTTGTFSGLPEGATIALAGAVLRINYNAGDGNDVVLTTIGSASVPTMSEWLTILLGLMMAAIAARHLATSAPRRWA